MKYWNTAHGCLFLAAGLLTLSFPAFAVSQTASAAPTSAPPAATAAPASTNPVTLDTDSELEAIIVTGTRVARSDLKTPFVATSISADQLSRLSATSAADILTTVPALKAESGGGEVAANVFVAGLPSTGQYQFTPLEFNGMPVIGSMGLNSTAPDAYYRYDFGVERLEFVRGGVSNLFGGGGIGGLINYIDRTGSDKTQGAAQLELSDQNRIRADFAASGPIANRIYYALSGFYRYDNGPVKTGFPTEGYQIRGNLKREFDTGEVVLYYQAIDDRDQFYGDLPLSGVGGRPALGNSGRPVYATETSALDNISFQTPNGTFRTNVKDGAATHGGAFALSFKKDLGDGWGFDGRGNVANYHNSFALFSGGDNITNLPTTQAGFLSSYGYKPTSAGGLYTGTFTFANGGGAVPSNYLLWGDRVTDRDRPLSTATLELNLTKLLNVGDWNHHFTLGGFFGHTSAKDIDVSYSYIGDFDNRPQLVNVTVTNTVTGAQTIVAQNGLVHARSCLHR